MMELLTIENLIALLTLTSLEVILGIDNIVFIAIITEKLDPKVQAKARRFGLILAMLARIVLLLGITVIMKLTKPLFVVLGHAVSGKDIVLIMGGLFLLAKATYEIHDKLDTARGEKHTATGVSTFGKALVQIVLIDMVFSLDSVITAVGMARSVVVMIVAVVISIMVMLIFAGWVTDFVSRHPTIQMLALSFLLLIAVFLVAEGLGKHIERGYIYFAMFFSLFVEILNLRAHRRRKKEAV